MSVGRVRAEALLLETVPTGDITVAGQDRPRGNAAFLWEAVLTADDIPVAGQDPRPQ